MRPPQPGPASPQPEQVTLGLNPCPWEVIDRQRHIARCKKHGVELLKRSGPRKDGKGQWTRYDCPAQASSLTGRCTTGGWPDEIFEDYT